MLVGPGGEMSLFAEGGDRNSRKLEDKRLLIQAGQTIEVCRFWIQTQSSPEDLWRK